MAESEKTDSNTNVVPSAVDKGWGPSVANPNNIPDPPTPVPAFEPEAALSPEKEEPAVTEEVEHTEGDEILRERRQMYGPNPFNQETVALQWQAILESHFQAKLPGPIPAHIVGLMMVGLKLMRASTPYGFNADNFMDAHNYLTIAQHCDPRSGYKNPVLSEGSVK